MIYLSQSMEGKMKKSKTKMICIIVGIIFIIIDMIKKPYGLDIFGYILSSSIEPYDSLLYYLGLMLILIGIIIKNNETKKKKYVNILLIILGFIPYLIDIVCIFIDFINNSSTFGGLLTIVILLMTLPFNIIGAILIVKNIREIKKK